MDNNERAIHWQNQIEQWQASGVSGARFCKEHELDLGQFYYWSNKYSVKRAEATQNKKCPTGFGIPIYWFYGL